MQPVANAPAGRGGRRGNQTLRQMLVDHKAQARAGCDQPTKGRVEKFPFPRQIDHFCPRLRAARGIRVIRKQGLRRQHRPINGCRRGELDDQITVGGRENTKRLQRLGQVHRAHLARCVYQ